GERAAVDGGGAEIVDEAAAVLDVSGVALERAVGDGSGSAIPKPAAGAAAVVRQCAAGQGDLAVVVDASHCSCRAVAAKGGVGHDSHCARWAVDAAGAHTTEV